MAKAFTDYLSEAGLEVFEDSQLVLPEWVKRLKIDVGLSYSASNSIRWIREDPGLMVFGFEPLPESCMLLQDWISKQEDSQSLIKQLIIIPVALAQEETTAQLHVTANDTASSSLLPPKKLVERESIMVQVFPLSRLLKALPWAQIQRVDYLKLDCQGLDVEILKEVTKAGYLERIALVTAEPEDDQYLGSSNSLNKLVKLMKSQNFIHINERSKVRVLVGKLLSRLRLIRALRIRFPVMLSRKVNSPTLSVIVEDPTFVNPAFLNEVMSGNITGFQKG